MSNRLYKYTPGLLLKVTNPQIRELYDLHEDAEVFCVEPVPTNFPITVVSLHAYLTKKNKYVCKPFTDRNKHVWEHCVEIWNKNLTVARPHLPGILEFKVGDRVLVNHPMALRKFGRWLYLTEGIIRGIYNEQAAVEILDDELPAWNGYCDIDDDIDLVPSGKGEWYAAHQMYKAPTEEEIMMFLDLHGLVNEKIYGSWWKVIWNAFKNWYSGVNDVKDEMEELRKHIREDYLTYVNRSRDLQRQFMDPGRGTKWTND